MATDFDAALLRLKGALQVQTDKQVAEALGMSPNALNERKRREAFPVDKVRVLGAERGFDADYVVTGVSQAALEMIHAAREGKPLKKVSAEDAALLAAWHSCSAPDQRLLLSLIKRLTTDAAPLSADGRYPKAEEASAPTLHERRRKSL